MSRPAGTFLEHVRELRRRLIVSFLFFVVGGVLAYYVRVRVLAFVHHPLNQTLYYTTPAGAFSLAMKISLLGGIVFLLPALTYNLLAFVQPALSKRLSKHELRFVTLMSLLLAIGGAMFAYYVVLPMSLNFFGKFKVNGLQSLISANDYVNFVINCLLTFVIIFQVPLILLFIDHIKRLPPGKLLHYERHVIVGSLVIALILPFTYDPLTQFLIAIPIVALYNLSIILVLISHHMQDRRHRRKAPKMTPEIIKPSDNTTPPPIAHPPAPPAPRPSLRPLVMDVAAAKTDTTNSQTLRAPVQRMQPSRHTRPVQRPMQRPLISDIMRPSHRPTQSHRGNTANRLHESMQAEAPRNLFNLPEQESSSAA